VKSRFVLLIAFISLLALNGNPYAEDQNTEKIKTGVDLGTYGKTYPVKERPPHEIIKERLKNFKMPPPKYAMNDIDLPKARENRTRILDPTYTIEDDIVDSKGNVLIKKGTTINPQKEAPLKNTYLFIDPTDPEELNLAKKADKNVIIEITKGDPGVISKAIGRKVYKAYKLIIKRFGVKVTPSMVKGHGKYLKIIEFVPSDTDSNG